MQYRALGKRGDIQVSPIALGCWPFAGGNVWGEQDDTESIAAVHAALDEGINFIDTAEGYGRSEEVLGRGLKGRRHEAVVATKVSEGNLRADDVITACERSLRTLQTDYIDLYQIHWPNWEVPLAETVGALDSLQTDGKIRAYGVLQLCRTGSVRNDCAEQLRNRSDAVQPGLARHRAGSAATLQDERHWGYLL